VIEAGGDRRLQAAALPLASIMSLGVKIRRSTDAFATVIVALLSDLPRRCR
jgi:hypothetical protein